MSAFSPTFAMADTIPVVIERPIDEVACNCYLYVKARISNLPMMKDVVGSTTPSVGAVAIFEYIDKHTFETVKHIAIITSLGDTGFYVKESNFVGCEYGKRFIEYSDSHIRGFATY